MPNYLSTVDAPAGPAATVVGQVVVEGVVMRAPGAFAVAVRRPTGEIVVRERAWPRWSDINPAWRWPVARGVIAFVEGVWAHVRALIFAADQAGLHGPLACATVGLKAELDRSHDVTLGQMLQITFWAAMGGLIALVVMPDVLAQTVAHVWAGARWHAAAVYLLGGAIKLGLLGLYLWHLHRLPHMRRLMMYHGAEHKVIAAFEAGLPLELAHVRRMPILYPRSGVGWGLWSALLATGSALLLFAVPDASTDLQQRLAVGALRALLWVPAIGLGYELSHWTGARLHRPWVRALVAPSLWLQRLTVREPSDAMTEVALVALRAALARSGRAQVRDYRQERFGLPKLVSACARTGVRSSARAGVRGPSRISGPLGVTARMGLSS